MTEEELDQLDKYFDARQSFEHQYEQLYPRPKIKLGYGWFFDPIVLSALLISGVVPFIPLNAGICTGGLILSVLVSIVMIFRVFYRQRMEELREDFQNSLLPEEDKKASELVPQIPHQSYREQKKQKSKIYLMKSGDWYKIGISQDPEKRRQTLATTSPHEITIVHTFITNDPIASERKLHKKYSDVRGNGEWFRLSADDVEYIKTITEYKKGNFNHA